FNPSSIIARIRHCRNPPRRCSSRPRLGEAGGDPYVYTDLGKSVHRCDCLGGTERPQFSQEDLWILGRGANFSRPVSCFRGGRMEMGKRFESRGPWIVRPTRSIQGCCLERGREKRESATTRTSAGHCQSSCPRAS